MTTIYADRATLLRALTQLHEETIDTPATQLLFGGAVLIREISARQRQNANDAAVAQGEERPDQALYRAMLIQSSVVNPTSGTPYADGRRNADGEILIDPRTRVPMFTVAEVLLIADGRDVATRELADRIVGLSRLGPEAMFSGDQGADGGERNAGAGDPTAADAAPPNAGGGTGNPDQRDTPADPPVEAAEPVAG